VNALAQGIFTFSCLRHAVPAALRARLWIAWWPLALAQAAWLAALVLFAHPLVSGVMVPLLTSLAGPEVLHYPNVFRILPALQARGSFVAFALLGPVVSGAAVLALDAWFAGRPVAAGRALGAALRRAPALIVAQAPLQLVLLVLTFGLSSWLDARGSSGLVVRIVTLASLAASVVVQALFLYVPADLMLGNVRPHEAWRDLPRNAGRAGMVALMLVALAAVIGVPIQAAASMADRIVERGRPELMVAVVAVQALLELGVAFVLAASSVLAFRSLIEPSGEDA